MTDNWQEKLVEELARKYNMGAMRPERESDGWSWNFELSESGKSALREAIRRTLEQAAPYMHHCADCCIGWSDAPCDCGLVELRQLAGKGK